MHVDGTFKTLIALILGGVAGLFAFAVATFERLPERIPAHFNASGVTDRFANKEWAMWLSIPGVALLVCTLTIIISLAMLKGNVRWMNIPYKQRFLELAETEQQPILRGFAFIMMCTGPIWCLLVFTLQWNIYRVAMGRMSRFDPVPIGVLIGLILIMVLGGTLSMARRIREQASR